MPQQTTLKYLNVLMGIAFLGVVGALFLLKIGLVKNADVIEVHEICGVVLIIGIFGHLVLNRKWISQVYVNRKKHTEK